MEEKRNVSANLAQYATSVTDFLADRRGLPLILAFLLVLLNFFVQFFPVLGWFAEYDILLHLGVLLAIAGTLLSSVL